MHLRRSRVPKTWPLKRKGTKYLVRPSHSLKRGIPLLIVLRDILNVVKTRKEAKKLLNAGGIKVNGKQVREESFPLLIFDNLELKSKNFKLVFKNKKFGVSEVNEKEANQKIAKITGKKSLKQGKVQINLSDGRNYIIKDKAKVGDSVLIDLKENKVIEVLPFKSGCKIMFMAGKHTGEEGVVEEIGKGKIITLKVEKEKINTKLENLMVIK